MAGYIYYTPVSIIYCIYITVFFSHHSYIILVLVSLQETKICYKICNQDYTYSYNRLVFSVLARMHISRTMMGIVLGLIIQKQAYKSFLVAKMLLSYLDVAIFNKLSYTSNILFEQ